MKKIIYTLLLIFPLWGLGGCNDDDNTPKEPVDALPQPTQVGANTFGCLLDGEPFIPSGGNNSLDCVYQLINGERFFNLEAAIRDENFNEIALSLSTNAKALEEDTYVLVSELTVGGVSGKYIYNGDIFDTDDQHSGQLIITHLDINEQIVSGRFFFDIIDQNGKLKEVTEGRFDIQFTQ